MFHVEIRILDSILRIRLNNRAENSRRVDGIVTGGP